MKFLTRSLHGLFLTALTIGLLALAAATIINAITQRSEKAQAPDGAREQIFAAHVIPVEATHITPHMSVFGQVRARRTLELRSPRAGTIIEIAPGFENGAEVREGQLLLRFDPADVRAAYDIAQTGRDEAKATRRNNEKGLSLSKDELAAAQEQVALRMQALTRQEGLQKRGIGSPAQVETAALALSAARQALLARRQALAQAEANQDQAHTQLRRAEITLAEAARAVEDSNLYARFDGRLNLVSVAEGRFVGMNEPLGQIIDPNHLEIALRLSTTQFLRISRPDGTLIAAPVVARLDVLGAQVEAPGIIQRAGAESGGSAGAGASGRLVYAEMSDAHGFRPGDFVTVRITEPMLRNVARLPATALGGQNKVLVLGENDRLEAVSVEVLRREGDDIVIAAQALSGREIVKIRTATLGAGIRILPKRQGFSAQAEAPLAQEVK